MTQLKEDFLLTSGLLLDHLDRLVVIGIIQKVSGDRLLESLKSLLDEVLLRAMLCPQYSSLAKLDHPGDGLVLALHGLDPHLVLDVDQLGPALLLLLPPQTGVHQLGPHADRQAPLEPAPLAVCSRDAVHLTGHVPADTGVAPSDASTEEGPGKISSSYPYCY